MDIKLPTFKYHPDPVKTGSAKQVNLICSCCNTKQYYKYTGPIYSLKEPSENICLFCIADGSAAKLYQANFTATIFQEESIAEDDLHELKTRTPGFIGWQEPIWLIHCHSICAYSGLFETNELIQRMDSFKSLFFEYFGNMSDEDLLGFIERYNPTTNDNPAYHKFTCLKCNEDLVLIDHS